MALLTFGANRAFRKLLETATDYAGTSWPVLILGETGVGKELLARHLHDRSGRASSPFLPVNCGAIPAGLFESELFGFERGAFSGALQPSRGLLRQAHKGTLFLDEIGDLDLPLQVKLLRFLDSGEVRSLGSARFEKVDVRIVAATNVDLFRAAALGHFRGDLLERLSVLNLEIPPLRERKEDIALIARSLSAEMGLELTPEALHLLGEYEWPGNIRQLRNIIVRASCRSRGGVASRELIEPILRAEESRKTLVPGLASDYSQGSLADIEKQVIVDRLRKLHGNRKRAAEELGIAKSTLHEKLRKWNEESPGEMGWPVSRLSVPGLGTT